MQHDIRPNLPHFVCQVRTVPHVQVCAVDEAANPGCLIQIGVGGRGQGDARDMCADLVQPQCKPAALKAGMTGQEDMLSTPEFRAGIYQIFHGALPVFHRDSSKFFSRRVSMGCQNPRCSYA
ncbi:hypothetical protein D3C72_1773670 [compost metagenome]